MQRIFDNGTRVTSLFTLAALIFTSVVISETSLISTEVSAMEAGSDQVLTSPELVPSANLSNLAYSTFLGGASADEGREIAVDSAGNIYVAGVTSSPAFPTTAGAFDTSHNGSIDIFVVKLDPTATALIYSTFIGGSGIDQLQGLSIDTSGNIFVVGNTQSTNYPTTPGSFDTTANGSDDAFVTKLNSTGSALIYSTFIGGTGSDSGFGIDINAAGNAFIVGATFGLGYPTTAGAFDTSPNGGQDVFVTQLNTTGSALTYSTFIGGSNGDVGTVIAVDASDNVVLSGHTSTGTPQYPTTAGAFDTTHNGSFDLVVTKLNSTGSALTYSTFIGGSGLEGVSDIALDAAGNAFITGETENGTYPTTPGAFDTTYGGSIRDAFVTKINPTGSALVYSTFLGGSSTDQAYGIALDSSGNAVITGRMESANYPTTPGAYDTTHNGSRDAVVTQLNAAGSGLIYSTFIGAGAFVDEGFGIALDSGGNVFITGLTANTTYPTTLGAFDTTYNNAVDAFVSKLGDPAAPQDRTLFDFDGDHKADVSVFRPAAGEWYYQRSLNGTVSGFGFGASTDRPVPADLTGDGKTDIAFFRPSTGDWFVLRSEDSTFFAFPFGGSGDIPAPADFDGDGEADPTVYRPSAQTWFILKSTGGVSSVPFGLPNDIPVPADYDGDGMTDVGIFRPDVGQWWILRSSNGSVFAATFGTSTDKPVVGDYTGDGKADVAFFRPSEGTWYVLRSEDQSFFAFPFGNSADKPAPADFDGDGKFDAAVFRSSDTNWYILKSTGGVQIQQFGAPNDVPLPGAFVP